MKRETEIFGLRGDKLRVETVERRNKPDGYLREYWPEIFRAMCAELNESAAADDFIDIVRTANLRAGTARERGLIRWRDRWYGLKYVALIKAASLSQRGKLTGLQIERDPESEEKPKMRFTFESSNGGGRYSTVATISTLAGMLDGKRYKELFGNVEGAEVPVVTN